MNKEFSKLYLHPKWQKRKAEILKASDYECQECGEKEKTLHVHHCYYITGKNPWEYDDEALMCLCEKCHKLRKEVELNYKKAVAGLDTENLGFLANTLLHKGFAFVYRAIINHGRAK